MEFIEIRLLVSLTVGEKKLEREGNVKKVIL